MAWEIGGVKGGQSPFGDRPVGQTRWTDPLTLDVLYFGDFVFYGAGGDADGDYVAFVLAYQRTGNR
ncbi:hypothetical protein MAALD49_33140 [Marinobacter shengliensis]|nr:hypothetical protein MAALD49_33140 [Marinobacter shengliensis]